VLPGTFRAAAIAATQANLATTLVPPDFS
jgi:hypothetical protein